MNPATKFSFSMGGGTRGAGGEKRGREKPQHKPQHPRVKLKDELDSRDEPEGNNPKLKQQEIKPDNKTDDSNNVANAAADDDDEEEDYMKMTFADATPLAPETSLQRRERLRREGEARGRVKSKAELEAEAVARREAALSRSLLLPHLPPPAGGDRGSGSGGGGSGAVFTFTGGGQQQQGSSKEKNPAAKKIASAGSKGLAMMARMGFKPGEALGSGSNPSAATEPLRISVKADRAGVGAEAERKRALLAETSAAAATSSYVEGVDGNGPDAKKPRLADEGDFRARVAAEREAARRERLVVAAQGVAERLDEEKAAADAAAEAAGSRGKEDLLSGAKNERSEEKKKTINILYRGLVRRRAEAERERRVRRDLESSLGLGVNTGNRSESSEVVYLADGRALPTYAYDDAEEGAEERMALGLDLGMGSDARPSAGLGLGPAPGVRELETIQKKKNKDQTYITEDDSLDSDADPELEAFESLSADERLRRLVDYLRREHRYCFWCKCAYPDDRMEGCPGVTEEDHD